jgi:hypothetical protein
MTEIKQNNILYYLILKGFSLIISLFEKKQGDFDMLNQEITNFIGVLRQSSCRIIYILFTPFRTTTSSGFENTSSLKKTPVLLRSCSDFILLCFLVGCLYFFLVLGAAYEAAVLFEAQRGGQL